MSEEEFVKKLLGGERDFNKICLPDGADLRRFIPELNDYLTEQELAKDKIVLCNSRIIRIIAPKIYIPYSNMSRVNMSGANMYGAHMSGADMSGADMSGADMSGADIRNIQHLRRVIGLESVIFKKTIVTEKEKEEILKAREGLILFDLR